MRSRGDQGDGTDHTKTQAQIFTRFGLTWHQKVHFSEILEFQCTRNGPQNLPFCPGSLQDTFVIHSSISHQHISSNIFFKQDKIVNRKLENLKISKIDPGKLDDSFFPEMDQYRASQNCPKAPPDPPKVLPRASQTTLGCPGSYFL